MSGSMLVERRASRPSACRSCPTCSASPRRSSGRRAASSAARSTSSSKERKPGIVPCASRRVGGDARLVGRRRSRASAKRSWLTNAFASESWRMYAISGARQPVVDRHVVPSRPAARRGTRASGATPLGSTAATVSPCCSPSARSACDDLVGPGEHVAGRVLGAVGVDDREVAGILLRVLPEAHVRSPVPTSSVRRGSRTRSRFAVGKRVLTLPPRDRDPRDTDHQALHRRARRRAS